MKPGEVWSCGLVGDTEPWLYVVVDADPEGVDLILLDSFEEPGCDPGDRVSLSWEDVRCDMAPGRRPLEWKLIT